MQKRFDRNLAMPIATPNKSKRLVYLDHSFLSEMCFHDEPSAADLMKRLFLKLQYLKERGTIGLVVSDIHCSETAAFPGQYSRSMERLWQFQNNLVGGRITANWADVFVAQHRRMLAEGDLSSFPIRDIKFREPDQGQFGMRVVMTNSWLLRMHRKEALERENREKSFREVIDRQAKNIPYCNGLVDCLKYVRELWQKDIRLGIAAWRERRDFVRSFERFGGSPNTEQLLSLKVPEILDVPYLQTINAITFGLDEEAVLKRWSNILEGDLIGPCPSLRIRTAFEAELLCDWFEGKRQNPKNFSQRFGWSRQNDIDHVSAFVPYVDALTTDRDMHNLCQRQIVHDEIKRFPSKIFSKRNYDKLEEWLDEVIEEGTIIKYGQGGV